MPVMPGREGARAAVVPADWELAPVSCKGEVLTGKALAVSAPGTRRPYLRTKNVFDGRIDIEDVLTMPMTDPEFSKFKINVGDILLNEGQTLELVGRCAMYRGEYPDTCAMQNQLIRFRAYPGVNAEFASHLLRFAQKSGVFARIALQTTSVAHLGGRRFGNLILAWPPLPEQHAIATALSDVDALLSELDRLIAKKRNIKQAAMQQLLTGQTRLPGFSGEWKVRRLGDHVTFLKNGVNARSELVGNDGVSYLHYGDIHVASSARLDFRVTDLPKLPRSKARRLDRLVDGDLVLVDASEDLEGVGKAVELVGTSGLEVVAGLHTIAARFERAVLADGFKAHLPFMPPFRDQIRRLAAGTKVYATNRRHIAAVEMMLPDVEEQQAIAAVLSDMDAELAALEQRREKTRLIKQAMADELLTGRIRLV